MQYLLLLLQLLVISLVLLLLLLMLLLMQQIQVKLDCLAMLRRRAPRIGQCVRVGRNRFDDKNNKCIFIYLIMNVDLTAFIMHL